MPALAVRLLGPVEVTVDRRALGPGDFGGQIPKRVLEVLLCHQGDAVPKERLIDLVWGDAPPRRAMAALENYVSVLRHRISDDAAVARHLLVTAPGAYRVRLDEGSLDIWRFDQLVAAAATQPAGARHGLLAEALGLARGELLADEPYADFAVGLRALYAERLRQARLDGAEDLLAIGRFREAAGWAEHALDTDDIAERGYRILILAHYALGEQGAALHAYDRCRAELRDAIGASPLPETEALYLAVLNQTPAAELLASSTAPEIGAPGPKSTGGGPAHPSLATHRITGPTSPTRSSATGPEISSSCPVRSPTSRSAGRSRATPPSSPGWPSDVACCCSTRAAWACPTRHPRTTPWRSVRARSAQ